MIFVIYQNSFSTKIVSLKTGLRCVIFIIIELLNCYIEVPLSNRISFNKYTIIIRMIKYPAILLFMTIVFFGCSNSSFDKIKGKWSASGDTGDSTELHTWYLEYEFYPTIKTP